ncbi:hypothetical protein ACUTJJ_14640 [Agrobacterium sp. DKPNP3]|uniref:hypothetical protein n=1 Tax=Agrobacterium sp. DKPNP3 TaxID=3457323 RepID=UPI004044E9AC
MGDLDARLLTVEARAASFTELEERGIQASLDYIQVNVAPQLVNLKTSIDLAQAQIDQIIIGGKAPDTLKFGGKEPSYYATALALSEGLSGKVPVGRKINGKELSVDVELSKADVGLDKVNNTSDADKPISTATGQALDKRITGPDGGVVAGQVVGFADDKGNKGKGLTPEEVRIFAQVMKGGAAGRDYLINGNFQYWRRGTSQTAKGYGSHDRWFNNFESSVMSTDRLSFAPGQIEVPGYPRFYSRTYWTPGSDNAGAYAVKAQTIYDVTKFAGKLVTLHFSARCSYARPLPLELGQNFGSGGSPSPGVLTYLGTVDVTTAWQRFKVKFVAPDIAGKTLGTDDNSNSDILFWLDGGTNYRVRNGGLTRKPAGWIDLAMVSIVDGDATGEELPVPWYDPDLERRRVDFYCQPLTMNMRGYLPGNDWALVAPLQWSAMRRAPDIIDLGTGSFYNGKAFNFYNVVPYGARGELISAGAGDVYAIDKRYLLFAE